MSIRQALQLAISSEQNKPFVEIQMNQKPANEAVNNVNKQAAPNVTINPGTIEQLR